MKNLRYLLLGALFGVILTKSEVISWFRIQEMFRFHSFHLYGVIGSAILVGMVSIQLIKRYQLRSVSGEQIQLADKKFSHGVWLGGLLFGVGWALTGACPGPMFALLGSGMGSAAVLLLSALLGTWTYSALREKLPH